MFVPGKLFQPNLMFVGKARGLPKSGSPQRCFNLVGPGLASKHWTRLERLAKDKHSSVLRRSVNYGHNKFYSTGPRLGSESGFFFHLFFITRANIIKLFMAVINSVIN